MGGDISEHLQSGSSPGPPKGQNESLSGCEIKGKKVNLKK